MEGERGKTAWNTSAMRLHCTLTILILSCVASLSEGDCEAPTNPNGGTYQTDPTTNSSTATISCAAGFVVNPPGSTPNITCQADGNWTKWSTSPCLRDCRAPQNPNGGTYQTTATTEGSNATIRCSSGFLVNPS
eukprot:scpid104584/ scgid11689/ 